MILVSDNSILTEIFMNFPFFEAKNCTVTRGKRVIIDDFSFSLSQGEITMLTGRNGSGKSTLLQAISGLLPLDNGSLYIKGQQISEIPSHVRLKNHITLLLQGNQIFPDMKVQEHFDIAVSNHEGYNTFNKMKDSKDTVDPILNMLNGKENQKAKLLSGGEKAILALGMVLLRPAPVMLFDEPVAGIAASKAPVIINAIKSVVELFGSAALVVEHDLETWNSFIKNCIKIL
jgi:branched-chain amino acid transport system ATP-binding protein